MMLYPAIAPEQLPDALRLIRTPNVGPVTFFALLERFATPTKALEMLPELAKRGGRKAPLAAAPRADALKEIEQAEKFGARVIAYGMPDYPKLLLQIPDAPPVISVLGHTSLWQQKPMIAMVGARNASANGCQFAQKLAKDLGEHGLGVASGLARGIDTFAHKGSLTSGTVAVIAGGIDNIYPPENQMLYTQIREMGAIISEQPFGAIPFAGAFPGRNRIIAGMSLGTVVVEASPKSGSLITARLTGDYNRELFAVPGSPLDPRSKGCNQLIKNGAAMVESAADIIQGIAHLRGRALEESAPPRYTADTNIPTDTELNEARNILLGKLSHAPVAVDTLIEQCGLPAGVALTVILELELAGRLRRSAGNKVGLTSHSDEGVA